MANPIFRFTLTHEASSWNISEPIGWRDAKLRLERHEEYHSLVEYFTGAFIFYGDNGVDNGGLDIIRSIEQNFGPDAELGILIEISFDSGINYQDVFEGLLDITSINENELNQAEIAIIPSNFWTKFIARKETPVDLQAPIDLDQNPITPISPARINLISQIVDKTSLYSGDVIGLPDDVYVFDLPDGSFIEASGATEVLNPLYSQIAQDREQREIEDSFALPMTLTDDITLIANLIELTAESGFMAIQIDAPTWQLKLKGQLTMISVEVDPSKIDSINITAQLYFQKNADTPILLDTQGDTKTGPANPPSVGVDRFFSDFYTLPLSGSISDNFLVGDIIRVYVKYTITFNIDIGADTNSIQWVARSVNLDSLNSTVSFRFKSRYRDNQAYGFLLHDAAAAVLKSYGLGVDNPFYSEILGGQLTNARVYDFDGCNWHYIILRGLQARNYALSAKPFAMSFDDWWKGVNPIFNLGLGYESITTVADPGFTPFTLVPLNMWGEVVAGGWLWTGGSNPFNTAHGPDLGPSESNFLGPTGVTFEVGRIYKYGFQFTYSGMVFPVTCEIHIVVTDIGFAVLTEKVLNPSPSGGSVSDTFEFVCPSSAARLGVRVKYPGAIGALDDPVVTIDSFVDLTVSIPPSAGGTQQIIEVEEKSEFYDSGDTSIDFDYVISISRKYDNKLIFNKIEIGYTQWKSEDISGIDDPQTQHTYATRFQKIGDPIQLFSGFIGASLALEVTRRQSIVKSQDYKYDDNTFIVSINPNDTSPDSYNPELDENFSSITNLLNEETRYNNRITPARNLLRWLNYLNISLQSYLTSFYKFVKGEGNYDMISDMNVNLCGDDFGGMPLSEKQDIPVTSDYLHDVRLYSISIPMTWEQYYTIRQNRKKPIGISQSDSNHKKFYIQELNYIPASSQATLSAWPKEYFEITQTDFVKPEPTCGGGECDSPLARITSDGDFRVTSDGECRVTV